MINFSKIKNYKISVYVLISAIVFALYTPFFLHVLQLRQMQVVNHVDTRELLPIYGSDSIGYGLLADNLLTNGILSTDTKVPFRPDTFRTYGYPLMLAIFKFLFGSYEFFPLFQMILVVGTAFLIFGIGKRVFSEMVGLVAAILYIVDPTTILHTLMVASDVSFTFFLLASIYVLFFWGSERRYLPEVLSGLLLGFSVMVRPIATYLPLIILPFFFYGKIDKLNKGDIVKGCAVFLFSFALVLVPWLVRNKEMSGVYGISSVKDYNLFHYTIPEFVSFKNNVAPDDIRRLLQAELKGAGGDPSDISSLSQGEAINKISHRYLLEDPIGYAKWHVVKMVPFFLSSGIKNFFYIYNSILGYSVYETSNLNLTNFLMRGQFGEFLGVLRGQLLITLEQIGLVLVFVLTVVPLVLYSGPKRFYILLFLALIFYLALPTVPVAYSRFRIPAAPLIFLLASAGVAAFRYKIR